MDPKELLSDPEQIKSLIVLLQSLLPEDASKNKTKNKKRPPKKIQTENPLQTEAVEFNQNIKTRNRRSIKVSINNKFDLMNEFNMHKEDLEVDKKLSKQPPVARTREFEPVSVTCRICGKKESVNPSLVHEGPSRYKCNNCATQAG
jgi:hypothetical protein